MKPRTNRVTAREGEGVIITEPAFIRIRRVRGSKGRRMTLEIVTAEGKVAIVKRELDERPRKEMP